MILVRPKDPEALRCRSALIFAVLIRATSRSGSRSDRHFHRHRLLRVGRFYQPDEGKNPGLLFMCLNADIDRQFEFVQQTWLASPSFHGLVGEQDR